VNECHASKSKEDFSFGFMNLLRSPTGRSIGKSTAVNICAIRTYQPHRQDAKARPPPVLDYRLSAEIHLRLSNTEPAVAAKMKGIKLLLTF
jgi:hypothetical protein